MNNINITLNLLIESGIHIGHQKNKWNPETGSYLTGIINNIHIIDIEKTIKTLNTLGNLISKIVLNNGKILIIGDKYNIVNINTNYNSIKYIKSGNHINGFLTNKESVKLNNFIPDCIFTFDINNNINIIKEAAKLNIPTIGIVNSDSNIKNITYRIPSNDDFTASIDFINKYLNKIIHLSMINHKMSFKYKYNIFNIK